MELTPLSKEHEFMERTNCSNLFCIARTAYGMTPPTIFRDHRLLPSNDTMMYRQTKGYPLIETPLSTAACIFFVVEIFYRAVAYHHIHTDTLMGSICKLRSSDGITCPTEFRWDHVSYGVQMGSSVPLLTKLSITPWRHRAE
jgi:hypothetical protein